MKKIALAVVTALIVLAVVPEAWAGDHKVRNRWEGAAIAIGGLILLDHILEPRHVHAAPVAAAPVYVPAPVYVAAPVYMPAPVYVREHRHYHYYRDGGWVCEFDAHRHSYHHHHYYDGYGR